VSDESQLVPLLQRANWTQLTLSAQVDDGSAVLVMPGKRYWYRSAEDNYVTGCDGGRPWETTHEEDPQPGSVHWLSGPKAPLERLLCPAWLLANSRLELRGRQQFSGREALEVVLSRRPTLAGWPADAGRTRVLVDAETGILLRLAEPVGCAEQVTELVRVDFAPVIDQAAFQPPPGSRVAESLSEALNPVLRAGVTAAGLAAGALGAWMRYSPFRHQRPAPAGDGAAERLIPRDEAPPGSTAGGAAGPELLDRLYAGGPRQFAATLHQWVDVGAMAASVPDSARRTGLGGLGLFMDALSDLPATLHTESALRFAGPGRYQIDRAYQPRRGPVTMACDGARYWDVYPDKITAGPPEPPPGDVGELAEPSWLLRCALSGGDLVTVRGRLAYRFTARRRDGSSGLLFPAAVALLDAELGVLLRLTRYIGDRPVQRSELRDVTAAVAGFEPRLPAGRPVTDEGE
jgi:hypothetical protein